ncbi:MAG: hypothetical protein LBB07_01010 [Bifidobacteriaceae bacterium]|nr:hypothetical protein [Bifidobacteriaceae bacterium]
MFGFISITAGVDLTQNANSAGSSSVVPILTGGTGANNAAGARTNLGVYSNAETVNEINGAAGWVNFSPNVSSSNASLPLYTRLLNNFPNWSFLMLTQLDLIVYRSGSFQVGKLSVRGSNKANTDPLQVHTANFCTATDNYYGANHPTLYVAFFKDADGKYSLWLKAGSKEGYSASLQWLRVSASKRAVTFWENANFTYQTSLVDKSSRTEPTDLEIQEPGWLEVSDSCKMQSPVPTPTASSTS